LDDNTKNDRQGEAISTAALGNHLTPQKFTWPRHKRPAADLILIPPRPPANFFLKKKTIGGGLYSHLPRARFYLFVMSKVCSDKKKDEKNCRRTADAAIIF
jgi:hypothetical protein